MKPSDEPPSRFPWPPVLLVGAIAGGALAQAYFPLRIARGTAGEILQGAGLVCIAVALLLYFLAIRELLARKTTFRADRAASHLVTTGPFAFSRNPIYLANVVLLIGWGLAAGNGWMVALAFVLAFAQGKLAIDMEEAHLERRFGKAWRDYRRKVRRWI